MTRAWLHGVYHTPSWLSAPADLNSQGRRHILHLILRDGPQCVWCGKDVAADPEATVDHVIPKAHGGSSGKANLVLACKSCNSARRSRRVLGWLAECEREGLAVRREVVERALGRARRKRNTLNRRR